MTTKRKSKHQARAQHVREPQPSASRAAKGSRKLAKPRKLPLYAGAEAAPARKPVPCTACALCCTYVAIEIDAPTTVRRATELLWYLYHEGVSLYENSGDWMVQFETTCKNLLPDRRCGVYETRPHICREYSEQECEVNTEDDGQTFYEPAELMAYLEKHKRRVHAEVLKSYAPPKAPVGGPLPPRAARLPFSARFREVRALGEC